MREPKDQKESDAIIVPVLPPLPAHNLREGKKREADAPPGESATDGLWGTSDGSTGDDVAPPSPKRQQSWGASSLARALTEAAPRSDDAAAVSESPPVRHGQPQVGLPQEGPHIFRGEWDEEGVYFYQAFSPEIAEWAVREQRFGGPRFNVSRMTWIKPSFAWVLYRAGYGRKHNQECIIKVKLPHALAALRRMAVAPARVASAASR